jgi:hypothetical protein
VPVRRGGVSVPHPRRLKPKWHWLSAIVYGTSRSFPVGLGVPFGAALASRRATDGAKPKGCRARLGTTAASQRKGLLSYHRPGPSPVVRDGARCSHQRPVPATHDDFPVQQFGDAIDRVIGDAPPWRRGRLKISVLAWGSIVWDRRNLAIITDFEPIGPCLPIEFCRVSLNGCLTLVIDEIFGAPCITYSAISGFGNLDDAIENLRLREGMPNGKGVGFIAPCCRRQSATAMKRHPRAVKMITAWVNNCGFDAAIWTALGSNLRSVPQGESLMTNKIFHDQRPLRCGANKTLFNR